MEMNVVVNLINVNDVNSVKWWDCLNELNERESEGESDIDEWWY